MREFCFYILVPILLLVHISHTGANNDTNTTDATSDNKTTTTTTVKNITTVVSDSDNTTTTSTTTSTTTTSTSTTSTTTLKPILLDPNVGCYCPGTSYIRDHKPAEEIRDILAVINEKRREEQQSFEVYSIPEEVPEVVQSEVPSEDILKAMFPDIGDDFEVDVWILTVSKMTRATILGEKANMKAKIEERLAKIEEVNKARSKFVQLDFSTPENENTTNTEETVSSSHVMKVSAASFVTETMRSRRCRTMGIQTTITHKHVISILTYSDNTELF